jgi:O-6-methylguanine DNA methyltransferase
MSTRGTHTPLRVYHTALATPLGEAHIFGTARGLLAIALPEETGDTAIATLTRRFGALDLSAGAGVLDAAREQLAAYFAGARRDFDLPLDLRGTPFQRAVWRASCAIPYGETRHYREIAATISGPAAARAVGAANAANPLPPIIPCHRLIGADGVLRGHRSGLATKRWLLEHERGACATDSRESRASAQLPQP